jgi:hypothetical protein
MNPDAWSLGFVAPKKSAPASRKFPNADAVLN